MKEKLFSDDNMEKAVELLGRFTESKIIWALLMLYFGIIAGEFLSAMLFL